jgi:hypothetical protein
MALQDLQSQPSIGHGSRNVPPKRSNNGDDHRHFGLVIDDPTAVADLRNLMPNDSRPRDLISAILGEIVFRLLRMRRSSSRRQNVSSRRWISRILKSPRPLSQNFPKREWRQSNHRTHSQWNILTDTPGISTQVSLPLISRSIWDYYLDLFRVTITDDLHTGG